MSLTSSHPGHAAGQTLSFGRHFHLVPDQPLRELDSPNAKAYLTLDRRFPDRQLFGLVGDPAIPNRNHVFSALRGQAGQNWLNVVSEGVISMSDESGESWVVALERPEGRRLWPSMEQPAPALAESWVVEFVIPLLSLALEELSYRHVVHGGIRPDNLFFMDAANTQVVLGECVTEPANRSQPVAFEPMGRLGADPCGRGEGASSADFYALGLTLLALITGADPALGRSDVALMHSRYAKGSYATFCEGRSEIGLGAGIQILLKGLLNDDPEARWGVEQTLDWCGNPRTVARRSPGQRRAAKPIVIGGGECHFRSLVPDLLHRHPVQAMALVRGGELGLWLRREFDDKESKEAIENLAATCPSDTELLSAASICVHAPRPLVYKRLSLMLEGIGTMVADAFARQDRSRLEEIAELVRSALPEQWISAQDLRQDVSDQLTALCTSVVESANDPSLGSGLERCLYTLNPTLTCQSPVLAGLHVTSLRGLVIVLDGAVGRGISPTELVDRHVAAFMMSHRATVAPFLRKLEQAGDDDKELRLAIFRLFARLQQWTSIRSLPNLTGWCAEQLSFVLEDYRSEVRREVFREKMSAAAKKGDLPSLQPIVESAKTRTRDANEFARAKDEYQAKHAALSAMRSGGHTRMQQAIAFGQQVAAALGSFVLALTISYLALVGG